MQLPQLKPRGKARRDRHRSRREPAPPPIAPPRVAAERRDARRGGGPQDNALYACGCGYAFTAPVTTSVACPHCGTDQAW